MNALNQVKALLELHKLEAKGDGLEGTQVFRKLTKRLDPSLLKRYLRLKEKKGTGVAVVNNNGACSGCWILYPETHDILRRKNVIHTCEYCGRLLVITDNSVESK